MTAPVATEQSVDEVFQAFKERIADEVATVEKILPQSVESCPS